MNENILVTGLGMVTPYGNTLEDFFNGLSNMVNAENEIKCFKRVRSNAPSGVEAILPLSCEYSEERILSMGELAIRSAINDWGGDVKECGRICLIIGSGIGIADYLTEQHSNKKDITFLSSLGEKLQKRAGIECETVYISTACSAGSQAISYAADRLHYGNADLVIAGGIDALSELVYAGFQRLNAIDRNGCKPFDRNRKGIMVGEGAAFFVLEREQTLIKNKKKIYCHLAGSGVTNDSYHIVQIKQDGLTIQNAMNRALVSAGLEKGDIDMIVAHGTGTILNDKTEAKIICDFFGDCLSHIRITAPKGAIGHTGGASGAFGLLTALGAMTYNNVPPISNLSEVDVTCQIPLVKGIAAECSINTVMINSFAFGGTNVVLVCKRWAED